MENPFRHGGENAQSYYLENYLAIVTRQFLRRWRRGGLKNRAFFSCTHEKHRFRGLAAKSVKKSVKLLNSLLLIRSKKPIM